MTKPSEKTIAAAYFVKLAFIFSIVAGGAYNYAYFIVQWAFPSPHLFLNNWGKPAFTILIAPFDQLGFLGARLFNILGGFTTAWICYLLASKCIIPNAWMRSVYCGFCTVVFCSQVLRRERNTFQPYFCICNLTVIFRTEVPFRNLIFENN